MYRIMKTHEFEDSVYFRATCSCDWHKHAHEIEVRQDEDLGEVMVGISTTIDANEKYCNTKFYEKIWWRIKTAITALFIGRIEAGSEFLFENTKQVDAYLEAIKKAMNDLKKEE